MLDQTISQMMDEIGRAARAASGVLRLAPSGQKTQALNYAADALQDDADALLAANKEDMAYARGKSLSDAMLDRLALTHERIAGIADGMRAVAGQEDPIGAEIAAWERPNGLRIRRVRTPIGVIGVIYESRPNVTADAGALCLKSGNAVILRGGSEGFHSSTAIHAAMVAGLEAAGLPKASIQLVPTRDRAAVQALLRMTEYVDVIVPRGGKGLVGLVQDEARVPVFAHLEGIVHVYLDKAADPQKALEIVKNAKTRRTGICGAAECLLVHDEIAEGLGRAVIEDLMASGVELRVGPSLQNIPGTHSAREDDWGREYLDMVLAAKTVGSLDEAMAHIRTYGSNHTDCIITEDDVAAETFFAGLDSAILMRNASTQFADGGEFGMGAEIGIATGKLHARGPVGAEQLTSFKYLVEAEKAIRP